MNTTDDNMNNDSITAALEKLTAPSTSEPVLYKKALESQSRSLKLTPFLRHPALKIGVAAMLVLSAGAAFMAFNTRDRSGAVGTAMYGYSEIPAATTAPEEGKNAYAPDADLQGALQDTDGESASYKLTERTGELWRRKAGSVSVTMQGDSASDSPRQVVHKSVLELQTLEVRNTYLKILFLPSQASGEFIQDSALAGGDPPTSANLTLRITSARLPAVLQQLRELGKITSETSTGEDVTDRLIDLGARLRNEERIETELLELIATRKDSQLKDILDVREQLARVRGTIEQLRAQQAAAQKSVSLATILIVIRAAPEAPKPPPPEAGFTDRLSDAAKDGLKSAGNSVISLSRGVIAGLPWWTALAIGTTGLIILRRRLQKQAAREPAPAL